MVKIYRDVDGNPYLVESFESCPIPNNGTYEGCRSVDEEVETDGVIERYQQAYITVDGESYKVSLVVAFTKQSIKALGDEGWPPLKKRKEKELRAKEMESRRNI